MVYWTKNVFSGSIFKGKANSFKDVSLSYGDRLYNPYTRTTVIGWNKYKDSLLRSQSKLPKGTLIEERKDRTIYKYPSGKVFVKHKSLSEIYGKAYDRLSDG